MSDFVSFTILGLVTASVYAVAASGLVVTYTTSGIFNFAHGAIGMMGAFMYWQLLDWGLPTAVAIALVLLVIAPLAGVVIDRLIMRGLEGTPEVTRTVVTVGLLFGLIALAPIIWPPNRNRIVGEFFGGSKFQIGDVFVSYHQIVVVVIAGLVAVGLRLLLYETRTGIAMRAVVSNRDLVRLTGGRPDRASATSWALGCSLAALAGILIADRVGLEVMTLTLLVVNAYAAAIVGRLVSLPMTFLGAVILGLAQSYAVGYLPQNPDWLPQGIDIVTSLRLAIPVVMLFIVLLVLPQAPLRTHGIVRSREVVARPSMRSALIAGAVLVVGVGIISSFLNASQIASWSKGLAFAIIMVSLVPLTGYGGQISLAQMSFAGLGAYAMATWGSGGSPLGLLGACVLPALVGALVALPAVRLRGIYLALATLAFAVFMDRVVFTQDAMFRGGSKPIDRLSFLGISFESDRSYMILLAVVFAAVGIGVVHLRLGPFGRRLQAMKDSPAACATLGLNLTVTKLQVFMLSAGIAGLGGAMLGGLQKTATVSQYDTLQSLPVLLMAVAGGIGMVSGALFGGVLYASFPVISEAVPPLANLLKVAPGLIGMSLGRNPNGAVSEILIQAEAIRRRLGRAGRDERAAAGASERPKRLVDPVADIELLGVDRPFTPADLALIDEMLGLDEEELARGAARG
jgi:branched-chain amino acid transport system permease protein